MCEHTATRRRGRGFTLFEAALVTVIISFGVVGMLQLVATGTVANSDGAELTTGMNMARGVREMMLGLSFTDPETPLHWGIEDGESVASCDDTDDFDAMEFSPPIDARRRPLHGYEGWRQRVEVQTCDPDWLTLQIPRGSAPANRVTVTVSHSDKKICALSWYVFDASQ